MESPTNRPATRKQRLCDGCWTKRLERSWQLIGVRKVEQEQGEEGESVAPLTCDTWLKIRALDLPYALNFMGEWNDPDTRRKKEKRNKEKEKEKEKGSSDNNTEPKVSLHNTTQVAHHLM